MIQIQSSRLILNWRRVAGNYPSYGVLLPEFLTLLSDFSEFAKDVGCDALSLNQWELTYVNDIEKGELWSSFDDLRGVFSGHLVPKPVAPVKLCDTLNENWRYIIGENVGRLHVGLHHVKTQPAQKEALRLQLIARGPLSSSNPDRLKQSFDLGHEAIVRTFAGITSRPAHEFWRRTQ